MRLGVGGRTVIAIFLDGVIGQLGIDTQLERGSCGEEGGSDLGVGCNDELFGAEITGVPAAAGGVGSLSEDVVCGEGVDTDLILVSWEWHAGVMGKGIVASLSSLEVAAMGLPSLAVTMVLPALPFCHVPS